MTAATADTMADIEYVLREMDDIEEAIDFLQELQTEILTRTQLLMEQL